MRLVAAILRVIGELAREQGAVPVELSKNVSLEACMRLQELGAAALPRIGSRGPPPHPGSEQWKVLDRPDVRVPLDERLLFPEQPVELGDVVRSEPTPEDELLRWCNRRDRVDLQEAELSDGVEDGGRRPVEAERGSRCSAQPRARPASPNDSFEPDHPAQPISARSRRRRARQASNTPLGGTLGR
jgi:hypothetical protein